MPMAVERRGLSIQSQCNTDFLTAAYCSGRLEFYRTTGGSSPPVLCVNALAGSLARGLASLSRNNANASDRSYLLRVCEG